jgi:hypothetical protein
VVDAVVDGSRLPQRATSEPHDVAVIDLMLPSLTTR